MSKGDMNYGTSLTEGCVGMREVVGWVAHGGGGGWLLGY